MAVDGRTYSIEKGVDRRRDEPTILSEVAEVADVQLADIAFDTPLDDVGRKRMQHEQEQPAYTVSLLNRKI